MPNVLFSFINPISRVLLCRGFVVRRGTVHRFLKHPQKITFVTVFHMSTIEVWRIRHLFVAEVNAMLSAVSVTEGEL